MKNDIPEHLKRFMLDYKYAPAMLKKYVKEVLHMTPIWYTTIGEGEQITYYVWNSRRSEQVEYDELALYW